MGSRLGRTCGHIQQQFLRDLPGHHCPCTVIPLQASMSELPVAKRARYLALGLPRADVLILADELATAEFFDATMAAGAPAKAAANWIMGDIMAYCKVECSTACGCSFLYPGTAITARSAF